MTARYIFAVLHLLALAIGIAAVHGRWRALQKVKGTADLAAVFHADNWYGIAVIIWLVTGLTRAFAGLEKGTEYYTIWKYKYVQYTRSFPPRLLHKIVP